MTYVCGKWIKGQTYEGNEVDMWEMAKLCGGGWLKHLKNGINMSEMTYRFGKW